MIVQHPPKETTDLTLAAMHREIARLEAACKQQPLESAHLKQRLTFLLWKSESLSIVYNWKKQHYKP